MNPTVVYRRVVLVALLIGLVANAYVTYEIKNELHTLEQQFAKQQENTQTALTAIESTNTTTQQKISNITTTVAEHDRLIMDLDRRMNQ